MRRWQICWSQQRWRRWRNLLNEKEAKWGNHFALIQLYSIVTENPFLLFVLLRFPHPFLIQFHLHGTLKCLLF